MPPLVEQALSAIEQEHLATVEEGLLTLAEVVAVNCFQNFRSDVIPAANDVILERAPLQEIQRVVQHWIERNSDHPRVGTAFWVLDKFHDKSLRPFLRQWLERYVQQIQPHLFPLGQILVALDALDEPILSDSSFSELDHGKNLKDAIAYLKSTDLNAPRSN